MKHFSNFILEAKQKKSYIVETYQVKNVFSKIKITTPNIREHYHKGEILQEGTYVKHIKTEQVGKIIRRGANHLICVTDDGMMFKSWINDVIQQNNK